MTAVWFETSVLAEVVKKAASIAPMSGREFDMYKGILISIRTANSEVYFRSTNGEVFYTERIKPNKIEGEDIDWRLSSKLLNDIVGALPLKAGQMCCFTGKDRGVQLTTGRMRASLPTMRADDYPSWDNFDPSNYPIVEEFAKNLDAVSWAVSSEKVPPLGGVYLDAEYIAATDRAKLAVMPVDIDLGENRENIVVPIGILNQVLRGMEEVSLGVDGNFLNISPYEDMWVKAVLYDDAYPKFRKMLAVENTHVALIERSEVNEVLKRVRAIGSGDRQVTLVVAIGDNMIDFHIKDSQSPEAIWESIFMGNQCDHEPTRYAFDPAYFADVFARTRNEQIMMHYSLDKSLSPIKFVGADGYSVILGPRREPKNG